MLKRVFDRAGWAVAGALAITTVLAVAGGVSGGPLDPADPPGSTPGVRLPGTPVSGPMTINTPGSYYLTQNISVPTGINGIVIAANDVTVDLNGFAIVGASADAGSGVIVSGARSGVVVRNGTVRNTGGDFLTGGVNLISASHSRVQNMIVTGNSGGGVLLGDASVLEDSIINQNTGDGVSAGNDNIIRRNQVESNGLDGIQVGTENSVDDNRVSFHQSVNMAAFRVTGHQNSFARNTIKDNWYGFRIEVGQLNTGYANVLTGSAGANFSAADANQSFAPFADIETSTNPWANVFH